MKKVTTLLILFALLTSAVMANNIQISNVSLSGKNTTNHFQLVNFDVSWDNSWRTGVGPSNWDAAWIFVKFRNKTGIIWNHATLHWVDGTGAADGHTVPAGATISSLNDNGVGGAMGVFLYASANFAQASVNYTSVQLRWDYGVDGQLDADVFEISVQAIEMVYVPQGAFQVGDGLSTYRQFEAGTSGTPYTVSSEAAITLGGGAAGSLGNNNNSGGSNPDDFNDGISKALPAAFPKGFAAFYCMKYSISQEQYVIFLNSLTRNQQYYRTFARTIGTYQYESTGRTTPSNRNGIKCQSDPGALGVRVYGNNLDDDDVFNEVNDGQTIECNYLSISDLLAYLDWSGLRPFSELEYEKLCRGPLAPVAGEYAWGSLVIGYAAGTVNDGSTTEVASNPAGSNCIANSVPAVAGPMRCGAMALAASTRVEAGATYYGIMDITGGLWEIPISVGQPTGRVFTGTHGDGVLDVNGQRTNADWPSYTSGFGGSIRGGTLFTTAAYIQHLQVSGRQYSNFQPQKVGSYPKPYNTTGGRGVKTAQ